MSNNATMDDQLINKKRKLPSWMTAVGCSQKAKQVVDDLVTRERTSVTNTKPHESVTKENCPFKVTEKHTYVEACDIISQSMPFLNYSGPIIYSFHKSDCAILCDDISSTLKEATITPVGFDMEWPVTFKKGGGSNKTALIQMCFDKTCYLFHVGVMEIFPRNLKNLILDTRISLVGLNIESDLWKLCKDFDINVKQLLERNAVIDIGKLANEKLKSSEHWSLEGLCRNILQQRIDKTQDIRCGDWKQYPLDKQQKLYAATDAYAGLVIYKKLCDYS